MEEQSQTALTVQCSRIIVDYFDANQASLYWRGVHLAAGQQNSGCRSNDEAHGVHSSVLNPLLEVWRQASEKVMWEDNEADECCGRLDGGEITVESRVTCESAGKVGRKGS